MTYGRTEGGCYKILAREVLRELVLRYETYADNLIAH